MSTHAHGTLMAEKRRKRQADDDPDWVPGGFLPQKKRQKVAASSRPPTGRQSSTSSAAKPDCKTRLLYVLDNVPHENIIDKLKTAPLTDSYEGLVASLLAVFDEAAFPPPGQMIHCTEW